MKHQERIFVVTCKNIKNADSDLRRMMLEAMTTYYAKNTIQTRFGKIFLDQFCRAYLYEYFDALRVNGDIEQEMYDHISSFASLWEPELLEATENEIEWIFANESDLTEKQAEFSKKIKAQMEAGK